MIEENPAAANFFDFQIKIAGSELPIPNANIRVNQNNLISGIIRNICFFKTMKHHMYELLLFDFPSFNANK